MTNIILNRNPDGKVDFNNIPSFTKSANYVVNYSWESLQRWLDNEKMECGLELNPWFQRGYVWNDKQRTNYIEYILRGGNSGKDIYFNNPDWNKSSGLNPGELGYVCVDGLQRITAVTMFMNNKVKIFNGLLYKDFNSNLRFHIACFIVHINDLKTELELLSWYNDLNSGGTVHTEEDLSRVRNRIKELTS